MASVSINTSMHRSCCSQHVTTKHLYHVRPVRSLGTNQAIPIVAPNVQCQKASNVAESHFNPTAVEKSKETLDETQQNIEAETSVSKFFDERWKNGTWDLNMFIKHGKMDWDGVIVAGRAAMIGFFMSYFVDALTGLDVVGQTGNFVCKVGLLGTVIGVILLRRTQDFEKLRNLADEATFYDNQWKASWENEGGKNNI